MKVIDMNIVMLGPQGSGKGTQAKMAAKEFGIPHISTGDIFRENIKNGTPLGKKAKAIIDSGELVPDEITNNIVEDRLSKPDCRKGAILDGYPRNLAQAKALMRFARVDLALEINIPDEESVNRISGRLTCKGCDAIYSKALDKVTEEDKCKKCGGVLYTRDDDTVESIMKRLQIYHKETEPIKELFKKKGTLKAIDGMGTIESVYEKVKKEITTLPPPRP